MAGMRYQPQGGHRVDQSNSIGRSLALAVHGGAGLREMVGGGVATGRGSAQSLKGFPGGLAFDLRGVNAAAFFSARSAAALLVSDQTAIFDVVINGAPSGSVPSMGGIWRSTSQNDAWFAIDRDSADSLSVRFRIAGTTSERSFNIGASGLYGRRLMIAASIARGSNSGGTVSLRVAADGALLYDLSSTYSASGSTDVTPTGTEYLSVGSESVENGSRNCNAVQYGQYHLGRVVSAAEVASLSAQPWQIFAAPVDDDEVAAVVAPTSYTLTAASGSFSLVGSAAGLRANRTLPATPGALALAGAPAGMLAARRLAAGAGLFSLAGGSAQLRISRRLSAGAGAFALSGAAAAIRVARRLTAAPASFSLTGAGVLLTYQQAQIPDTPQQYRLSAASGSFGLAGKAVMIRAQRRMPAAAGVFALVGSKAALVYDALPPTSGGPADVSKIPSERIVVFEGSGSRVVVFEGSGSRVVIFEGSGSRVRFQQMNVSAKVPVKVDEKWMVDRDPDEISYYAADITQELIDRNTTADSSKITPVLHGVMLEEGPELQVEEIEGVQRTFVVVKLAGVAEELPADWRWVARVGCMNGERFDKTTWFNKVDP